MSLARLITVVCRAAYVIIVARALGAEYYGALSVALAWTLGFLPLTNFSLGAYLVAELSTTRKQSQTVLSQTLSLTAVGSALAAVAAGALGLLVEDDPLLEQLLLLFAVALLARGIVRWTDFVFIAYERAGFTLRQESIFRVLELSCVALVVLAGGTVMMIAVVAVVIWSLQALTGLYLVRFRLAHHPLRWDISAFRTLTLIAVPTLIAQLFSEGLLQYPVVLARHLIEDEHSVGNVALAMQALFLVSVVPWSLMQVALPALVRAQARGDGRDVVFVDSLFRGTALGTAALMIAAAAIGPALVPWLLGADYALAGELLWLSLLVVAPLALSVTAGAWLLAGRRYRYSAFCGGMAMLTLLTSAFVLIPRLGPAGVFLSAAMAHLVGALAKLLPMLKAHPSAFSPETRNALVIATATSLGYAMATWLGWPPLMSCFVALGILSITALRWSVSPAERAFLTPRALLLLGSRKAP